VNEKFDLHQFFINPQLCFLLYRSLIAFWVILSKERQDFQVDADLTQEGNTYIEALTGFVLLHQSLGLDSFLHQETNFYQQISREKWNGSSKPYIKSGVLADDDCCGVNIVVSWSVYSVYSWLKVVFVNFQHPLFLRRARPERSAELAKKFSSSPNVVMFITNETMSRKCGGLEWDNYIKYLVRIDAIPWALIPRYDIINYSLFFLLAPLLFKKLLAEQLESNTKPWRSTQPTRLAEDDTMVTLFSLIV
jgi:hypothetical protein